MRDIVSWPPTFVLDQVAHSSIAKSEGPDGGYGSNTAGAAFLNCDDEEDCVGGSGSGDGPFNPGSLFPETNGPVHTHGGTDSKLASLENELLWIWSLGQTRLGANPFSNVVIFSSTFYWVPTLLFMFQSGGTLKQIIRARSPFPLLLPRFRRTVCFSFSASFLFPVESAGRGNDSFCILVHRRDLRRLWVQLRGICYQWFHLILQWEETLVQEQPGPVYLKYTTLHYATRTTKPVLIILKTCLLACWCAIASMWSA